MSAPSETESRRCQTRGALRALGGQVGRASLAHAVRLGWLVALGEDRYEAPMPSLLDVAEEVVRRGVPLAHAVALVAKLREQCKIVPREFVELFLEDLWKPFAEAGYPQERWAEVTEWIERSALCPRARYWRPTRSPCPRRSRRRSGANWSGSARAGGRSARRGGPNPDAAARRDSLPTRIRGMSIPLARLGRGSSRPVWPLRCIRGRSGGCPMAASVTGGGVAPG